MVLAPRDQPGKRMGLEYDGNGIYLEVEAKEMCQINNLIIDNQTFRIRSKYRAEH